MSSKGDLFWVMYARIYDSISYLSPYRGLLQDLVQSSGVAAGERVLDAGCGTGNLALALQRQQPEARVWGLDMTAGMLDRARARVPGAELGRGDLDAPLPYADGAFDVVFLSNVLYALPRPEFTLRELRRVLHTGGRLVVATPRARFRLSELIREHLRGGPPAWASFAVLAPAIFLAVLFNLVILRRAARRDYLFLSREELQRLLEGSGFSVEYVKLTYADQDWLARAVAAHTGGGG